MSWKPAYIFSNTTIAGCVLGVGLTVKHSFCPHLAGNRYGYDERVSSIRGLYGGGLYFAHQSCKALQYARSERISLSGGWKQQSVKLMLVSRVTLGDYFAAQGRLANMRRAPDRPGGAGLVYDSELHAIHCQPAG